MAYSDLITLKELSPELRQLINSGGGTTSEGLIVVDDIYTKKVEATVEGQTEFEIPFEQYDTVNSYLDIKINSTWVNPDRYNITDNKIVLTEGVTNGTILYFTIFSLAQLTPDGGFIEDVEIAETPQEIIVYDGSVIDEKIGAHNKSSEAHEDIRSTFDSLANERGYLNTKTVTDANLAKDNGLYLLDTKGLNSPNSEWAFTIQTIKQVGYNNRTQLAMSYYPTSVPFMYMRRSVNDVWSEWKELATADVTNEINNGETIIDGRSILDYINSQSKSHFRATWATSPAPDAPSDLGTNEFTIEVSGNKPRLNITLTSYPDKTLKYVRSYWSGEWRSEWVQIAQTSKINNLTLLNGWVNKYGEVVSVVKSGSIVSISGFIGEGVRTDGTVLLTLPEGYRPSSVHTIFINSLTANNIGARITISTSGDITIYGFGESSDMMINGTFVL